MTTRRYIVLSLSVLCILAARPALAVDAATQQQIDQLKAQIQAFDAQITQLRSQIANKQGEAATLQRDITVLQGRITQLQVELTATNAKIDLTNAQITDTETQISQTQDSIERKRDTIGRMVLFLQQRDDESLLASLFKYPSLSTFLQQFHDLAQVQDDLVAAIGDLKGLESSLQENRSTLLGQQDELQQYSDQVQEQQQQMALVKNQKAKVLKDTKGQEAVYQQQLTDVEKKQAAYFLESQRLESQAIAGGVFVVHVTATSVPPKGTKLFRKPEDAPYLTQGYGYTAYAKRGAYGGAPHNGIDWASGYGTPVKAIGAGTIIAHGNNDGWGNWIAIQHPDNLVSIYGHMSTFAPLAVGTAVTVGQVIGYEGNTGNVTGSHVHLSLYREFFTYINPKNGQLYFNYMYGQDGKTVVTLNPLDYIQ